MKGKNKYVKLLTPRVLNPRNDNFLVLLSRLLIASYSLSTFLFNLIEQVKKYSTVTTRLFVGYFSLAGIFLFKCALSPDYSAGILCGYTNKMLLSFFNMYIVIYKNSP